MPGPRPNRMKPSSRHRGAGLVELPAAGCTLPVPPLPAGNWSTADRKLWRELWHSPQATEWDDSTALPVAMYLRHVGVVLAGTASAWQAAEARHLGDRLGLTPAGMAALGWTIAPPAEVVRFQGSVPS